ncbi:MAG: TetR/AcrR family transcriptional regulator [Kangiellaceae bacterium]|nr:TetR/AcrR family transcriptional regulator [Kangiellaceae bacterium]
MTSKTIGHIFPSMGRIGHCRQHILDAGIAVLSTKGYNGTGIKEIVDAAGVPKGSFYNHFVSKEAFVVEAIDKKAAENIEWAGSFLNDKGCSPKSRLMNFFDAGFECQKEQSFHGGCFIGNLCLEMSDENESIRAATSTVMCKVVKMIGNCLVEAQDQGQIAQDEMPYELAEFIHCAWEGVIMRMKGLRSCHAYDVFQKQVASYFLE